MTENHHHLPDFALTQGDRNYISQQRSDFYVRSIGALLKNMLIIIVSLAAISVALCVEVIIASIVGDVIFEQYGDGHFNNFMLIACTLTAVLTLHLAKKIDALSPVTKLIYRIAPLLAFLFIVGLSLFIAMTMRDSLGFKSNPFDDSFSVAKLTDWFSMQVLSPLASSFFGLGFAAMVFCTVFTISVSLEWLLNAIAELLSIRQDRGINTQKSKEAKYWSYIFEFIAAQYNWLISKLYDDDIADFAIQFIQYVQSLIKVAREELAQLAPTMESDSDTAIKVDGADEALARLKKMESILNTYSFSEIKRILTAQHTPSHA